MVKIAPSILAADFGKLEEEINLINNTKCEYIHCDIMDGHFVPNISFGPDIVKRINQLTNKILDVHLMINPVMPYIEKFKEAGADIITFHIEADDNPKKVIEKIKSLNMKAGLAIKPSSSLDQIFHLLEYIDLFLVMTVDPGFGGQKFIESEIEKIKKIKKIINEKNLNTDIEVDGGINNITGKKCILAGADILVAGSYIFNSSEEEYEEKINSLR